MKKGPVAMAQAHKASNVTDETVELSPQMVTILPIVATSFAFAFVVGYFSAFDVSWFPFFSLPEHVVFAIRALPVAVSASVVAVIALMRPDIWKRWRKFAIRLWVSLLLLAAIVAIWYAHLALMASFLVVAVATVVLPPAPRMSATHVVYLAITLMIASLMAGWISASYWTWTWDFDRWIRSSFLCTEYKLFCNAGPLPLSASMTIIQTGNDPIKGQIVFVGDKNILFYDYEGKETRLLQRTDVQEVRESHKQQPSTNDEKPQSAHD
jgi:hypothetical protein